MTRAQRVLSSSVIARPLERTAALGLAALLAWSGVLACSQSREPPPLPEEVRRAAEAEAPGGGAAPPEREEGAEDSEHASENEESPSASEPEGREEGASTVMMIDRGEGSEKPSLWEAAQAERERRRTASGPVASVTDENLHEYQDAELTFAEADEEQGADEAVESGPHRDRAEGAADEEGTADGMSEGEGEEYWRSRVLSVRRALRETADEIDELEQDVAALRRRFYAEDDPYVRDGRIKPSWDRARDRLTAAREELAQLRETLEATLAEGRRAGALPGWLREGIELEPRSEEGGDAGSERGLPIHEPGEPQTVTSEEPPERRPDERR